MYICNMINNIRPTDKIVVDLEMLQIDFNEQKKQSLRKEIAKKYNVPLANIEVKFNPITINEFGDRISLASDITNSVQDAGHQCGGCQALAISLVQGELCSS